MINLTYDIVGSFLRPEEIKEARKNFKGGQILCSQLKVSGSMWKS